MSEAIASPDGLPQPQSPPKLRWFNSEPVKVALVAIVFGLLIFPLNMIQETIEERQNYNVDYPQTYQGYGAGKQSLIGPVLTVPYRYLAPEKKRAQNDWNNNQYQTAAAEPVDGELRTYTGYLHLLPDMLKVKGKLDPELRDGGRFKNILYTAELKFEGEFDTKEINLKKIPDGDIMWDDAFVTLGVSDLRGVRKQSILTWGDRKFDFIPGTNGLKLCTSGQYTTLDKLKSNTKIPFSFDLTLDGSRDFEIFPAGKQNDIEIQSAWDDPNFTGGFLPADHSISKAGFNAKWDVSYFNRNFPQVWTDSDRDLTNSTAQFMVGVTLATPVEFYRTTIRAVKYGCMFIVMPFLALFIFERSSKIKIHTFQYLLVGLALTLFFLVLIALSEYLPFLWSYVIASTATNIQITWYTHAVTKTRSRHLWKIMAGILAALYAYLYVLLQLEDMSLLVGSLGLFVALSLVLFTTRNMWNE